MRHHVQSVTIAQGAVRLSTELRYCECVAKLQMTRDRRREVLKVSGERQRWRVAADCKSPVLYLVGSNPTSPTKVRRGTVNENNEVYSTWSFCFPPRPLTNTLSGVSRKSEGRSPA